MMNDDQQVVVADEVEPGKLASLLLQEVAQSLGTTLQLSNKSNIYVRKMLMGY
jgi:hypothetical protein